jgi:hypothetical protein
MHWVVLIGQSKQLGLVRIRITVEISILISLNMGRCRVLPECGFCPRTLLLTYQANGAWTVVSYEVSKAASEADLGANRVYEDTIGNHYAILVFPSQLIILQSSSIYVRVQYDVYID